MAYVDWLILALFFVSACCVASCVCGLCLFQSLKQRNEQLECVREYLSFVPVHLAAAKTYEEKAVRDNEIEHAQHSVKMAQNWAE